MLDDGMKNHQEGLTGLSGCLSTCHLNKVSEQPESASLPSSETWRGVCWPGGARNSQDFCSLD